MNHYKSKQNEVQPNSAQSLRSLLEQTKLSRLPERTPFRLPDFDNAPMKTVAVVAVCAGCGGRIDADDNFLQSIQGCRKCIGIYTRIDSMLDEISKQKTKELLEKFAGGAK